MGRGRQQLGQDLDRGLVAEDQLVTAEARKESPRTQPVAMVIIARAQPAGLGDDAIEGPLSLAGGGGNGGVGANQPVEIDSGRGGQTIGGIVEQRVQMVGAFKSAQHQNVLPQRRGPPAHAGVPTKEATHEISSRIPAKVVR